MKSPFLRADQNIKFQVVNKGLVRDLMCDVRSLLRCQSALLAISSSPQKGQKNLEFESPGSGPGSGTFSGNFSGIGSGSGSGDNEDEMLPMTLLRSNRALHGSTSYNIDNDNYSYNPPNLKGTIILELKDKTTCTLSFPDRNNYYLIWVWMKWLKLVISIQKGEFTPVPNPDGTSPPDLELPQWASVRKLTTSLSVVIKSSTGVEVRTLHFNCI